MGSGNLASAANSSAFGRSSSATHAGATAIGYQSETDRDNSVSVGNATMQKQIAFVAAGTMDTDAVNLSQLRSVVSAFGGGASISGNSFTAPTFVIQGNSYNNVRSAFDAVDQKLTTIASTPGTNGKSAYEIAQDNGFVGSQTEWLASLKGEKGEQGLQGIQGLQGLNGADGKDGINGVDGKNGIDGLNGKDGINGVDGKNGIDGLNGKDGINGVQGEKGQSAFEIAVNNGFNGTELEWLGSLKGDKGDTGAGESNPYIQVESNTSKQNHRRRQQEQMLLLLVLVQSHRGINLLASGWVIR